VEDHVALANRITEGLRDAGLAVDVVYDGAAAVEPRPVPTATGSCSTATCRPCTATGQRLRSDHSIHQSGGGSCMFRPARPSSLT